MVKEIEQAFQRAATEEDIAMCTAHILEETSPLFAILQKRTSELNTVQEEILRLLRLVAARRGEHMPLLEAVRVRKHCMQFITHDTSAARKHALYPVVALLPALGTVPMLEGRSADLPNVPHDNDTTRR